MTHHVASSCGPLDDAERLELARRIIVQEADALARLAERLDDRFLRAADLLRDCSGSVLVTGAGKAGRVGQKIADTLASTGTLAHFIHPADAVHGDLGRVQPRDVVVILSKSGETEEILQLLPLLKDFAVPIIAVTERGTSSLGRGAEVTLELGGIDEACPLGLAPSTSTTAMMALGDALALVVSRMKGFQHDDFARVHPGGSLGRKLSYVEDYMRAPGECRLARDHLTVRQVLIEQGRPGRRVGAVMLCDEKGRLSGLLTDSDVARMLESGRDHLLDGPVRDCMTRGPATIAQGARMDEAVEILRRGHFSELPVVDSEGRPVGLIDRADLDCFDPGDPPPANSTSPAESLRGPHLNLGIYREPAGSEDT